MPPQPPLLEVHVFAYNHAEFIERTLRSVLQQETRFPIGLRIHDDASTDDTVEIIERTLAASPVPWELVRAPQNRFAQGLDFWHEFLLGGSAPFIAVLDGDDLWLDPLKLQSQMDLLERHPSAVICHHRVVEVIGEAIRDSDWPPARFREEILPASHLSELNPISTSSVVIRRDCLPERMPDGFGELHVADYAVWALSSAGRDIAFVDRPMGAYRLHEGSMYSSKSRRHRIMREMETRLFIGQHVPPPEQEAWRRGLLDAVEFWLAENERLSDERDRIADDLAAVLADRTVVEDRHAAAVVEIEHLRASTSWRVTAPLRLLARRVRRTT